MVPDRAFFAVQRRFAERWAQVASVPVEDAYLECTTWYRQAAGLGRDFDPAHPEWRRLLAEVAADTPMTECAGQSGCAANHRELTQKLQPMIPSLDPNS